MPPASKWMPVPIDKTFAPRKWILQNEEIITLPPFEVSPSGSNFRIQGYKKSTSWRNIDNLVFEVVKEIATSKGTEPWLQYGNMDEYPFSTVDVKFDIFALEWKFKHETFPLTGVVRLISRVRMQGEQRWNELSTMADGAGGYPSGSEYGYISSRLAVPELVNSQPGPSRDKLVEVLEKAKQLDSMEYIEVPDGRPGKNGQYIKLMKCGTNFTDVVAKDISDLILGSTGIADLNKAIANLHKCLRGLGFVIPSKPRGREKLVLVPDDTINIFDPIAARTSGAKPNGPNMHGVVLDYATGSILVHCPHDNVSLNEAATTYENAKFLADLTGELDEFLLYTREYLKKNSIKPLLEEVEELRRKFGITS